MARVTHDRAGEQLRKYLSGLIDIGTVPERSPKAPTIGIPAAADNFKPVYPLPSDKREKNYLNIKQIRDFFASKQITRFFLLKRLEKDCPNFEEDDPPPFQIIQYGKIFGHEDLLSSQFSINVFAAGTKEVPADADYFIQWETHPRGLHISALKGLVALRIARTFYKLKIEKTHVEKTFFAHIWGEPYYEASARDDTQKSLRYDVIRNFLARGGMKNLFQIYNTVFSHQKKMGFENSILEVSLADQFEVTQINSFPNALVTNLSLIKKEDFNLRQQTEDKKRVFFIPEITDGKMVGFIHKPNRALGSFIRSLRAR